MAPISVRFFGLPLVLFPNDVNNNTDEDPAPWPEEYGAVAMFLGVVLVRLCGSSVTSNSFVIPMEMMRRVARVRRALMASVVDSPRYVMFDLWQQLRGNEIRTDVEFASRNSVLMPLQIQVFDPPC